MRILLLIAATSVLAGCGNLTGLYAPERMKDATVPAGSGRIVLSTGPPGPCRIAATHLKLLPEWSASVSHLSG
jgi:hypothetical protein